MYDLNENIINVYGTRIGELTGKPNIACKGLVRFSIAKYRQQKQIDENLPLQFTEFLEILSIYIRQMLKDANITNVDNLMEKLISELFEQQAMFTFSV